MYTIHTHTHRVLRTSSVRKDKFCKFYSSLYLVRFSVQASPCALLFIAFFFFFFFFPLSLQSLDRYLAGKKKKKKWTVNRAVSSNGQRKELAEEFTESERRFSTFEISNDNFAYTIYSFRYLLLGYFSSEKNVIFCIFFFFSLVFFLFFEVLERAIVIHNFIVLQISIFLLHTFTTIITIS